MRVKLSYEDVSKVKEVLISDPCANVFFIETSKYGEHLSVQDAKALIEKFQTWISATASDKEDIKNFVNPSNL